MLRTAMATFLVTVAATTAMAQTATKAKLKTPAALNDKAPDVYKANLDTSAGPIVIEVHRDWAPLGADRFYNLVKNGYYDDVRFFRVLEGFMAQFGMSGDMPRAANGHVLPSRQILQGGPRPKDELIPEPQRLVTELFGGHEAWCRVLGIRSQERLILSKIRSAVAVDTNF